MLNAGLSNTVLTAMVELCRKIVKGMDRKEFLQQGVFLFSATSLPRNENWANPFEGNTERQNETSRFQICTACGTQFPTALGHSICPICLDDRQAVPHEGQGWTTPERLVAQHSVKILKLSESLYEFMITPRFAIGQRAFLAISESGNILWDCIPLLDEATIEFIESKGGLKAIAFSHPHYYSNMNQWADAFDCPIYIHVNDKIFIHDKGPRVTLWTGFTKDLWDGITIYNIGGHFPGSSIVRIPKMSKEGVVLLGDTLYLSPSLKHFALMYSYPNRIPLPRQEVLSVKEKLSRVPFDTLYGFYSYQNVHVDAKKLVDVSLDRYLI